MAYLTRDEILNADDLPIRDVEVLEWGGTVRVRGLTAAERDSYEEQTVKFRGKKLVTNLENARARLCAKCMIGENGERLFSESEVILLGKKSGIALNRVFEVVRVLSGFSREDINELTENFTKTPEDGSLSD